MARAADTGGEGSPFAKFTDLDDTLSDVFAGTTRILQQAAA